MNPKRKSAGQGWAIRLQLSDSAVVWVTPTGGFVKNRCGRAIWSSHNDAVTAARAGWSAIAESNVWKRYNPTVVHIRFYQIRK